MKTNYKSMELKDLESSVSEMRLELIRMRSELASKAAAQKVGQIHKLKKNIARGLTEINEKKRKKALETSINEEA